MQNTPIQPTVNFAFPHNIIGLSVRIIKQYVGVVKAAFYVVYYHSMSVKGS